MKDDTDEIVDDNAVDVPKNQPKSKKKPVAMFQILDMLDDDNDNSGSEVIFHNQLIESLHYRKKFEPACFLQYAKDVLTVETIFVRNLLYVLYNNIMLRFRFDSVTM